MPSGTADKPGSGSSSPLSCLLCRETKRQLPIICVRIEVPVLVARFSAALCALANVLNANNTPARSVNSILKAPGNLLGTAACSFGPPRMVLRQPQFNQGSIVQPQTSDPLGTKVNYCQSLTRLTTTIIRDDVL